MNKMNHQSTQSLVDYWNTLRAGRPAPRRSEIEPRDIKKVLQHVFILERNDKWTYRFRLAGTGLCNTYGMEFRRHNMAALWQDEHQNRILDTLNEVTSAGAVAHIEYTAETPDHRQVNMEMILLPLAQDNGAVTRVLGAAIPLDEHPWIGSHMLVRQTIDQVNMLDLDELPAAPPLMTNVRRIVDTPPPPRPVSTGPSFGTRRQRHSSERPYLRLVRDTSIEMDNAK